MSGETVLYRIVDAMIERFPLLREAAELPPTQAPRPYPNWSGAGKVTETLVFEGGSLAIGTSGHDPAGNGYFVFAEDDAEWEQDEESPKVYRIVNTANSELIAIRDKLNEVFPPPDRGRADLPRLEIAAAVRVMLTWSTYETEYDGRMYEICRSCGGQDGDHRAHCKIAEYQALLSLIEKGR